VVAKKQKELSLPEYKSIIDQLKKEKTFYMVISGGEMLLKPEWFEIASYAKENGFLLFLLTNGTLITEGIAKKIKKLNPYRVEMSLYGAEPKTHEAITGVKGSFEKTVNAARLLTDKGVRVVMKSVLMKQNVFEQNKIRCLAKSIGAHYGINTIIFAKVDGSKKPLSMRASAEDLRAFYRSYLQDEEKLDLIEKASTSGRNAISCSVAAAAFVVNPFGEMLACIRLPIKLGSLRKQKFKEIWSSSPELLALRKKRKQLLKKCAECKYLHYCHRCPGIAYLEDGSLESINKATCIFAKIRTEEINDALKKSLSIK